MSLSEFPPNTMEENQSASENTALISKNKLRSGINTEQARSYEPRKTWPLILIILTLMLERVAYYGILSNLVVFLSDDLRLDRDWTVVCVFLFTSTAWLMSTIGGVVGDSYTGRFKAILGSLIIYIIGATVLEVTAHCSDLEEDLHKTCSKTVPLIVCTLFILSVGEGAFKANISAFGAEQITKTDDKNYRVYFNWFYWAINIGCFIGFSVIALVQQYYGFVIGYYPPLACLVVALILFLIPKSRYIVYPLSANVFNKVFKIMKEANAKRKGNTSRVGCPGLEDVMPIQSWLDRAMIKYGGSYLDSEVDEVKTLGKIGIMFLILVPYWMIYYQMNSTFLLQGVHMNLNINGNKSLSNKSCESGKHEAIIPAASLSLANVVVVLLVIPLMDKLIYPWLDKRGWAMNLSKRILVGFLLATSSMVAAGIVEYFRYKLVNSAELVDQCINKKKYKAANLNIFYQVPQYALIGISEVFASVGSLEFAYQEAPQSMHGFVMGLFYLVQSVASLIGAGLYAFSSNVLQWTCNVKSSYKDPNLGEHLDYYFYLLGSIMFVTWLLFVILSVKYDFKYQTERLHIRQTKKLGTVHGRSSRKTDLQSSVIT